MTIACTRCGAQQEGDIIVAPLAFGFKHNRGCGHGVGPLAVIPSAKKVEKPKPVAEKKIVEEIKVEEKVKEDKPKGKTKVFGDQKD